MENEEENKTKDVGLANAHAEQICKAMHEKHNQILSVMWLKDNDKLKHHFEELKLLDEKSMTTFKQEDIQAMTNKLNFCLKLTEEKVKIDEQENIAKELEVLKPKKEEIVEERLATPNTYNAKPSPSVISDDIGRKPIDNTDLYSHGDPDKMRHINLPFRMSYAKHPDRIFNSGNIYESDNPLLGKDEYEKRVQQGNARLFDFKKHKEQAFKRDKENGYFPENLLYINPSDESVHKFRILK